MVSLLASVLLVAVLAAPSTASSIGVLWKNIPGRLIHITASTKYLWGVNTHHSIYRCTRPCNGPSSPWTQVAGALKQIDADDEEVWGVNKNDYIYKRPVDGSGSGWTQISGRLKHVSASGKGYIWGVNSNEQIYKCAKPCSGNWHQVSGSLKQIDGGEENVYGVNRNDQIYTRPVDGSGSGWRNIPGGLKHITASGSNCVYGVNSNNQIYQCRKPCYGTWERIDGSLAQCDAVGDADDDRLYGVNSKDYIYLLGVRCS